MADKMGELKFSKFVDELVQNSECFSFNAYNVGLQKYVKHRAKRGFLGNIEFIRVDPYQIRKHPISLLLGETNRMAKRYPLINELLEYESRTKLNQSAYYKTLWRYYADKNMINKFKGALELNRKMERIFKMNHFIKKTEGLSGIDSYLRGQTIEESNHDYPINISYDLCNFKNHLVQLDGSHRRCICYFNNICFIQTLNIKFSDLVADIEENDEPYLKIFLEDFLNVIKMLHD